MEAGDNALRRPERPVELPERPQERRASTRRQEESPQHAGAMKGSMRQEVTARQSSDVR